MKYHTRNINNLNKLADHTKVAAFKWYQYCIDNGIEMLIYETIRTIEQQRKNVAKGASQTMRSYHLVGQALDFVPINSNGTEDWEEYWKEPWASVIRYAKNIGFEWGGDWKEFVDSPHLQWNHKGYGTDTFNGSGAQDVPDSPPSSNGGEGIAYIEGNRVNLRTGPGTNYDVVKKVYQGEKYRSWGYKDGWYNVGGNQWVSGEYVRFDK
ncbi:M15 family metallopeptidase [Bacillus sp. CGMCC 1.60114]|uniref:M15 family metallopeptidase n=1 Tax=unclassified Bacillus (in: firmicutes) TaxID=185979 RepID=UPI00363EFD01